MTGTYQNVLFSDGHVGLYAIAEPKKDAPAREESQPQPDTPMPAAGGHPQSAGGHPQAAGGQPQNAAEERQWYDDFFQGDLTNAAGGTVPLSSLKGKIVAMYFSASWCGPCRGFTPQLVKFYNQTAKSSNLEIVLVSCDRSEQAMTHYMQQDSMPWLAVPFGNPSREAIIRKLGIGGIPALIVFGSDGKRITSSGRSDVTQLGEKAVEKWQTADGGVRAGVNARTSQDDEDGGVAAASQGSAGQPPSGWLPGPTSQWYVRMDLALADAKRTHRNILVLSTGSDWCGWCRKLYADVLSQPMFIDYARKHLILFYMDQPNAKPMPQLQKQYNSSLKTALKLSGGGVPHVWLLDEDGCIFGEVSGYRPLDAYMRQLKSILMGKHTIRTQNPPQWVREAPTQTP